MTEGTRGTGRAAGKVILFGEHAVVYGVPAIAAGIDRGATAIAWGAQNDEITVDEQAILRDTELLRALEAVRNFLHVPSARILLSLEIPAGAGLGASAAMGVATARALCSLYRQAPTDRQIFLAAQAWEKIFHGTPSGVDVAAATSTGVIRFTKTEEPRALILAAPLNLVVARAGPPASTRQLVESVSRLRGRNPTQFERTLEAIAALVENALLLLRSGDVEAVGKLMDLNQMLLAGWMLSTEEIERACHAARDAGALGAKLTGAGGGGCVIALCGRAHEAETEARRDTVLESFKRAQIPAFATTIGGVTQEPEQ
jgi:mevalonate kinase